MADYPGSLYTKTTVTDDVTDVLAAHHNDQEDEILAVETELGTDVAGSAATLKARLAHSINDAGYLEFDGVSELTISSGAVTVTQNFHTVDTEADAASDNLDTINGGTDGMWLVFRQDNDGRDVTIRHGEDNIVCPGENNIVLSTTADWVFGVYDADQTAWMIARGASDAGITGSGADEYIAVWDSANSVEGTDDLQWNGTLFYPG